MGSARFSICCSFLNDIPQINQIPFHLFKGVDAYILDSGIDISHPDFEGRARWGYTGSSINEADQDFHGHGTHVAGTVGGRTYGVAKGANLIAVKVE